jgi:50S ribosomal protein L16 3-hydroxylase
LIKSDFSSNFVSPDELAGLSLEDDVESRIIKQIDNRWQLQHGPFSESTFSKLPETHWTLLVQTVDHWVPQVQQLLKEFSFIPRWRLDDLMVSYATDQGGVGPHYDRYDVFLIQTEGERRWRVGKMGDTQARQNKISSLIHLETFEPVIDVIMQPGDMLYVPPNTPHWGESIGESVGYSVGYRAPQTRDLLALLAEHFEGHKDNQFFTDSYRQKVNFDNQLEPQLITWAQEELRTITENQQLIGSLLSQFLSQSKIISDEPHVDQESFSPNCHTSIQLAPGINCNWFKNDSVIILSVEGESVAFDLDAETWIRKLTSGETLEFIGLKPDSKEFAFCETLARIVNRGYFLYR